MSHTYILDIGSFILQVDPESHIEQALNFSQEKAHDQVGVEIEAISINNQTDIVPVNPSHLSVLAANRLSVEAPPSRKDTFHCIYKLYSRTRSRIRPKTSLNKTAFQIAGHLGLF